MKVKGAPLRNSLQGLEKLHGKEGVERVLAALAPRHRAAIASLKPLEWYHVEHNAAFHVALRDTFGRGISWKESHAISAAAAQIELNGVYRLLLRAVQYDTIWDRMERVWPQFYDAGEARWVDRARGYALARFSGVAGFNEGMWESVAGRTEMLIGASGAKGANITIKELSSTQAVMEAMWLE